MAAIFGIGRALFLAGALLLVFNPVLNTAKKMPTAGLTPKVDILDPNISGICKSVDIRNTLKSFENLRGCRVVEGFVQILLFDNVNESSFDSISFPELTEITDFLLLYRVNGLRSVGQLFPNLAVIRGQDKVLGYSFVVYEMSSLQEIGLHSLTDITSGHVRIDKNPSLCFVNSIDWDLISHEKGGDHFIKNVKPENECPLCPGEDDSTDKACPISKNKNTMDRHLCWNRQHCQKVCPKGCKSCDVNNKCCDEKCLGGCDSEDSSICHVCRNFTMGQGGRCMNSCPHDRFEYLGRRCVTRQECINFNKPLKLQTKIQHDYPYKIHNNKSCLLECPSDYMDDYVKHRCVPCLGRCKKECQGMVIDSIASAKRLRGCTRINGSLEIQIRGGRNVVNELEENLSMIEEIDGYIKVVRSFPLVSLNFFKNLKIIRGNSLENQKYVFVVSDNQNLQDIWNWQNRTLQIDKGSLFFHFNPKLCLEKIRMLRDKANMSDFTDLDVASNSNGDKIACNVQDLAVNVTNKSSRAIVLQWPHFEMKDHRKLLGYVVYSIKAPHKNITLYDGRDACGGDGWRVDDVHIVDQKPNYILTQLEPYTQYAFYVKTYTIASELSGAQSQIYYIRTRPDKPSIPYEISVKTHKSSDSLHITWKAPLQPNGNVTYYIVTGVRRVQEREDILRNRNYCSSPTTPRETLPKAETKVPVKQNNTCECKDTYKPIAPKLMKQDDDVSNQILFEDRLINFVYIKRERSQVISDTRRKRDVSNALFPSGKFSENDETRNSSLSIQNKTDTQGNYVSFNYKVPETEVFVKKLKHFTTYDITIQACRDKEGPKDDKFCSEKALKTVRTEKKVDADTVSEINVYNQSSGNIKIGWEEPSDPNGHILTYQIIYKRLDIENSQPILECITALEYLNNNKYYTLKKLNPGNYSLRIVARSQADFREYTKASADFSENSKYLNTFYIKEPHSGVSTPAFIISILIIVFFVTIGYFVRKKYCTRPDLLISHVNPEYVSTKYEPDDWEVHRDKIKLIKELGQGSFGMVYEGIAKDIKGKAQTKCAIKTVNEHATNRERIEFLNEASVMKAFDTAHVVRLLGVVSQGQPTLVVMELMANGDLKSYLRSHRPDVDSYIKTSSKQPPTLKRILQMAIEIADGMAYLSAKKYLHRDLAARNCMVAEDLTVKIGDFGMTRDIYETDYYRKGTKGLLPVRWMAPESLKDGVFTSSSDVWSYGVVLWEMATLASQPYQGLSNDQVLRYVIDGGIMERPENCPDKLYNLMINCWRHKPTDRPTFLYLCKLLLEDSNHTFSQVSFYHSAAGMEARNSRSIICLSQDDPTTPLRNITDDELRSNPDDENFEEAISDESEEELEQQANIEFDTYPSMTNDVSSAANGYICTPK